MMDLQELHVLFVEIVVGAAAMVALKLMTTDEYDEFMTDIEPDAKMLLEAMRAGA